MTARTTWDAWNYRESAVEARGKDVTGCSVEAVDGRFGKIDPGLPGADRHLLRRRVRPQQALSM